MNNPGIRPECEEMLSELEELNGERVTISEVSASLTAGARRHSEECADCRSAVDDLATTRQALAGMGESLPQPGPWFTARVMAAVKAAENEIEERKEGVWVSVRRFAPRLAAFAALLLVLGGTWAMELRRQELNSSQRELRQTEGLFDAAPSAPNDDIVAAVGKEARP